MDSPIQVLGEVFGKYGIGGGIIVVLCIISYLIIKHILKQSDKILDLAMTSNEKWQKIIDEHTAQNREFSNQVTEAHRFQREEHLKMLENQNKLCLCFTQIEANQRETATCLARVKEGLGRINGYHV